MPRPNRTTTESSLPSSRRGRSARPALGLAALLAVAAVSLAGCGLGFDWSDRTIGSGPYTTGSGHVVTATRQLASFHAISVSDGMTVSISAGDAPAVDVTADDNLVPLISTTVRDGALTIRVDGSLTTRDPIRLTVTAATAVDSIVADSGSTVDAEDLGAPTLTVSISGGSTLHAGGSAATLEATVREGSTADMRNLRAATVRVSVSTGSTAHVDASDSIAGECNLGSTLRVSGSASTAGVSVDTGSTLTRE